MIEIGLFKKGQQFIIKDKAVQKFEQDAFLVDLHPTKPWILVISLTGKTFIWNYQLEEIVKSWEFSEGSKGGRDLTPAIFVPRKSWTICGNMKGFITVYDDETFEIISGFQAYGKNIVVSQVSHKTIILSLVVHPSHPHMISSSLAGTIKVWNWENEWACTRKLKADVGFLGLRVAFNPGDYNIFSGAARLSSNVLIWNLDYPSPAPETTITVKGSGIKTCIDFYTTDNMLYLLSVVDNDIEVWECTTKYYTRSLEGHKTTITCISVHQEFSIIFSCSEDGIVCIWNPGTWSLEREMNFKSLGKLLSIRCVKGSNKVVFGGEEGIGMIEITLSKESKGTNFEGIEDRWTSSDVFIATSPPPPPPLLAPSPPPSTSKEINEILEDEDQQSFSFIIKEDLVQNFEQAVFSVDLHPTKTWILAISLTGRTWIWNYKSEEIVKSWEFIEGFEDAEELIMAPAAFIPRKNWIISGNMEGFITVYDDETFEIINEFQAYEKYFDASQVAFKAIILCFAVHPSHPIMFSSSAAGTIKFWNWDHEWACTQEIETDNIFYELNVAFKAGYYNIFAGGFMSSDVQIWDIDDPSPIPKTTIILKGSPQMACTDFYMTNNVLYLLSGASNDIQVWEYQTKRFIRSLEGHENSILSISVHQELSLITSCSEDGIVCIWNLKTWSLEKKLAFYHLLGAPFHIRCVKGSNKVVFGGEEGIGMLDITLSKEKKGIEDRWTSPDPSIAALSSSSSEEINEFLEDEVQQSFPIIIKDKTVREIEQDVFSVDLHPAKPWILVVSLTGRTCIWNYKLEEIVKSWEFSEGLEEESIMAPAAFIPRKSWIISGNMKGFITVYDDETFEIINEFRAYEKYNDIGQVSFEPIILCLVVHPSQPYMISSSVAGIIKLWNWENEWNCTREIETGTSFYGLRVAFNAGHYNIFASGLMPSYRVQIWDVSDPSPIPKTTISLEGCVEMTCFDFYTTDNMLYLLSGGSNDIQVWEYNTESYLGSLEGHKELVTALSVHQEHSIIISGSVNGIVCIWNLKTWSLEQKLNFDSLGGLFSIRCVEGSNRVVFGGRNGIGMIDLTNECKGTNIEGFEHEKEQLQETIMSNSYVASTSGGVSS